MRFWRDRRRWWDALSEIGCGFLTVLLVTIPLWVFTVAARGPGFALTVMALTLAALVGVALLGRRLRR